MRRDIVVLIVVVVVVGLMISAAVLWSRRALPQGAGKAGGGTLGDVHGQPAPDFDLKSLEGKQVKLSSLRGKPVVLNFWATWCEPCKLEMPWFEELHKQYAGQVEFVGVAMDDAGEDTVRKFAKEVGVTYTILIGKEAVGEAYGGLPFLPTTFYIGRDGKIVERSFGIAGKGDVEANIKRALASTNASLAAPASVVHTGFHASLQHGHLYIARTVRNAWRAVRQTFGAPANTASAAP